jgi:hypothetical protein
VQPHPRDRLSARRAAVAASLAALAGLVGYFGPLRSAPPLVPAHAGVEARQREELEALGYVEQATEASPEAADGVTVLDRERAAPGVNVWCSVRSSEVHFMDLDGRILRSLRLPDAGLGHDCMVEPTPDGGFLTLASPHLVKWSRDLALEWTSSDGHHHDAFAAPDGAIYTFSEQQGWLEYGGRRLEIRDHAIAILGPDGRLRRKVPLSPLLGPLVRESRLRNLAALEAASGEEAKRRRAVAADVFHPNGIQVLDRDIGPAHEGSVLLCARELDRLAIVDLDAERLVWSWGEGELDGPHHPTLVPGGSILVFDNGRRRGWSRLLEVDPLGAAIRWQWRASPPAAFSSRVRGSVVPLANGNLLVTESARGRVFELTRGGKIVWEFHNPERSEDGATRRQLYRMIRIPEAAWEGLSARALSAPRRADPGRAGAPAGR